MQENHLTPPQTHTPTASFFLIVITNMAIDNIQTMTIKRYCAGKTEDEFLDTANALDLRMEAEAAIAIDILLWQDGIESDGTAIHVPLEAVQRGICAAGQASQRIRPVHNRLLEFPNSTVFLSAEG